MLDNSSKFRLAVFATAIVAVGLVIFTSLGFSISRPYVARRLCKEGQVISQFRTTARGGYYIFSCKVDTTGEVKSLGDQMLLWTAIVWGISLVMIFGFVVISSVIIVKVWGTKKIPSPFLGET